jgi:hypothetical protein
MKYLFTLVLFFFLSFSFAQDYSFANKWLSTTLNQKINISKDDFFKANIKEFSSYKAPATSEFIDNIFRDNLQVKPVIKSQKNCISVDYSNESASIFFYVFEDRILFTYRVNVGSDEQTVIYNLKTKKMISFRFWTAKINGNDIYFEADSYEKGHNVNRGIISLNKIF